MAPSREYLTEKFWSRVSPEPNSGCWIWIGGLSPNPSGDYGHVKWMGRYTGAHRVAYSLLRGSIPFGLELDHLCRFTRCVNPWHLEPVPRRVNLRRGFGFVGQNARKVNCPRGHAYDILTDRFRGCRTCRRERDRNDKRYRRWSDPAWRTADLERQRMRHQQRRTVADVQRELGLP